MPTALEQIIQKIHIFDSCIMIVANHQRNVAKIVTSDLRGDVVPQLKAVSASE